MPGRELGAGVVAACGMWSLSRRNALSGGTLVLWEPWSQSCRAGVGTSGGVLAVLENNEEGHIRSDGGRENH